MSAAPAGILMTMHRFSQGGADRVGVLLANGFVRAGIPTRIALLRDGGEGDQTLRALADPRVAIVSAGRALRSRHLELVRGVGFLRREIADTRPALVLASSNNMGLVTGIATGPSATNGPGFAMKVTNPVVRPHDGGRVRRAYRRGLYRFIFGHYERILVLTEAERDVLVAISPRLADRFHTVANPYIANDLGADGPRERRAGPPHILAIGRMMPQKRLDLLLRAFAQVADGAAQLTILGDGPLRPNLEQLAAKLGIAGRVHMPGFVDDVAPWFRTADLFALSSDYEGLPAALLEALACNVPVVTTDCFAGARALLADAPSCVVTPVGDPVALGAALAAALDREQPAHDLRPISRPYAFDAAIAAHIAALAPLLRPRA